MYIVNRLGNVPAAYNFKCHIVDAVYKKEQRKHPFKDCFRCNS